MSCRRGRQARLRTAHHLVHCPISLPPLTLFIHNLPASTAFVASMAYSALLHSMHPRTPTFPTWPACPPRSASCTRAAAACSLPQQLLHATAASLTAAADAVVAVPAARCVLSCSRGGTGVALLEGGWWRVGAVGGRQAGRQRLATGVGASRTVRQQRQRHPGTRLTSAAASW